MLLKIYLLDKILFITNGILKTFLSDQLFQIF